MVQVASGATVSSESVKTVKSYKLIKSPGPSVNVQTEEEIILGCLTGFTSTLLPWVAWQKEGACSSATIDRAFSQNGMLWTSPEETSRFSA